MRCGPKNPSTGALSADFSAGGFLDFHQSNKCLAPRFTRKQTTFSAGSSPSADYSPPASSATHSNSLPDIMDALPTAENRSNGNVRRPNGARRTGAEIPPARALSDDRNGRKARRNQPRWRQDVDACEPVLTPTVICVRHSRKSRSIASRASPLVEMVELTIVPAACKRPRRELQP